MNEKRSRAWPSEVVRIGGDAQAQITHALTVRVGPEGETAAPAPLPTQPRLPVRWTVTCPDCGTKAGEFLWAPSAEGAIEEACRRFGFRRHGDRVYCRKCERRRR